jgi:hypothetical protein
MQGQTYGSRVNQIWSALRRMPLQVRERQSVRVSFPCFWGLALLVEGMGLRVLRGVDAALDKTGTPLTADIPARAFQLSPRGQAGCVQQLGGIVSIARTYERAVKVSIIISVIDLCVEFEVAKARCFTIG